MKARWKACIRAARMLQRKFEGRWAGNGVGLASTSKGRAGLWVRRAFEWEWDPLIYALRMVQSLSGNKRLWFWEDRKARWRYYYYITHILIHYFWPSFIPLGLLAQSAHLFISKPIARHSLIVGKPMTGR